MVSVSMINPIENAIGKSSVKQKILKQTALPTVSGLGVLAGASMNVNNFSRPDAKHEPGSSVTDSNWDQLKYTGKQVKNAAEEIGSSVKKGTENLWDDLLDFLDDIF